MSGGVRALLLNAGRAFAFSTTLPAPAIAAAATALHVATVTVPWRRQAVWAHVAAVGAALGDPPVDFGAASSAAAAGLITLTSAWSHSSTDTASALAEALGAGVSAHTGEAGLSSILADPATAAVLVVLPVQAMPAIVERALGAGKHVLQEKPVAPTVVRATAMAAAALLAAGAHRPGRAPPPALWCLAENYRSEPAVLEAAARASPASMGPALLVSLDAKMPMNAANRYHGSAWRRTCPGGFLMDSSVHFLAALRAVTGPRGTAWGEPVSASAVAYGADEEEAASGLAGLERPANPLPSPDTLLGRLVFANARAASLAITFAGSLPHFNLAVEGRRGAVSLSRGGFGGAATKGSAGRGGGYDVASAGRAPGGRSGLDTAHAFYAFAGLDRELASFVRLVTGVGGEDDRSALSPAAAARDLAAVEALLASSAAGGAPVPVASLPADPWDELEKTWGV